MADALDVIELIDDMEEILREMDVPIAEFEEIDGFQFRCIVTPARLEEARTFLLGL